MNSPISDSKLNRLIDILELTTDSSAIDFGCGDGEFLIRLNQASNATCLGVDIDASLIAAANAKISDLPGVRAEFRQSDVAALSPDHGAFNLAVCMGYAHYIFMKKQVEF